MNQPIRQFATGATRDANTDKIAYDRFLSPLVIKRFGKYMHGKRQMPDGSVREPDNWQRGIPLDAYAESGFRHAIDFWAAHFGYPTDSGDDIETELCALIFNASGYLHELLKAKRRGVQCLNEMARIDQETGQYGTSHPMAAESLRDEFQRDDQGTGV